MSVAQMRGFFFLLSFFFLLLSGMIGNAVLDEVWGVSVMSVRM